jgi:flagellar hook-associated protein 3 FlgL
VRININPLDSIVTALALNQKAQNTELQQLSSGSSINQPSDNPVGAAEVLRDRFQKSADTQFSSDNAALQGQLGVADSALSSVITSLTQAITLGTQGANGTLSDANRQAIAQNVSGIKDQLMGLANTQFQGSYLFGGTNTQTAPYAADSSAPGGVSYNGNSNVNSVEIGSGQFTPTNVPGSKLFSGGGTSVFQAVDGLTNALTSGTGIAAATAEVQNAFNYVNTQRSFYGATTARLNTTQQFLSSEQTQLDQHTTAVSGADFAQVSSDLVQSQTAQQALVAAASKVDQGGLINILH